MWPSHSFPSAIALLAVSSSLFGNAAAQVTTDCFPMNKTCPADPAFGMDLNFNFNQTPKFEVWETKVGPVTWDKNNGAGFKITKQGDAPTIRSKFYYFGGRTEVIMKAAKGTGIISSVMMLSDNLDEIDWEFFGTNKTVAQTNYYGKGFVPEKTNGRYHEIDGSVLDDYHNYTSIWTKDVLDFYIDGTLVRTLLSKDANDTYYYPQTPMRLSIGIWAGGDPRMPKGTREWAGGDTDYSQGPFEMWVKSAHVSDYSSGKEYQYSDKSGSWESIKIVAGNSTIKDVINAPPEKSLAEKWNDLPNTTKIAIYASAGGVGGLLVLSALVYCIRQRRRGAREAKIADARAEAERLELERFKKAGVDPDSFASSASEYNAKEMRRGGLTDQDSYSVPPSPSLAPVDAASPLDNRWDTTSASLAGAAAMRSPVPLLRDGAQSPRIGSPSIYSDRGNNTRSPAPGQGGFGSASPSRHTQSPGPGSRGGMRSPTQPHPPARSFTSPSAQMRMGSPAPQHDFGGGMQRSGSPAPIAHPQPQRSFTSGGYAGEGNGRDQGYGGYGNGGGNRGGGGGGNQGYWDNGGGYR